MFRTRIRKILRDVWSRKVRTALVSISIFIGVFGVVTLFSTGDILVNQLKEDLQQDRLAMIRAMVMINSGTEVDNAAYLDSLRELPGVTAVEGRAVYPLFWKLPGDDTFVKGYIIAHTEPYDQAVLEPVRLIEGDYPAEGQNQIAVEQRMADRYDLALGDTLDLRILSQPQDGDTIPQETWTISGIVFQPYGEPGAQGPVDSKVSVFATYEDARHIAGFTGLNAIYARFTDFATADAESATFQSSIASNTPYVPVFTIIEDPAQNAAIESTRTTNNILVTLALVALIVSGFLVINVVNSIVAEQRRQIGVMKSLGATRGDTFFMYSGIATMYGLIGVVPGVLLGIPGGYYAAKGLGSQTGTVISDFAISPTAIILGIVVGLAVPLLASVLPVFNGTRVTILDAMTDFGIKTTYGRGPLANLIARLPIPITLRQALSNVNQKKFRLALTGTTLTLAAGAFMGIFAVFSALTGVVDEVFASFGTPVSISPNEGQDFTRVKTLIEENIPGVKTAEPSASLAIEIDGYNPPPISAGPPGLFAFGFNTDNPDVAPITLLSGTGWQDDPDRDGVVLSKRIADAIDKGVGDRIVILAGGNRDEFEIIGVAKYPFDTVWFRWETLAELGGLVHGSSTESEPYPNSIDLILDDPDPSAKEAEQVIGQLNDLLLANGITAEYTNWIDFKATITQFIVAFGVILNLAAGLIAAVGAIGLLTSLSMSVFERQKEIGVMRSVGASSSAITFQFLVEGLIIGIIAWAIGIPISYLLSRGLIRVLNFGDLYDIAYPPVTLLIGLVGMLVVVTIASLWPSLAASRRTVSDILRYQ